MMFNDDNCFLCRKKHHIGHHYPQTQCYNLMILAIFLDCLEKTAPSETPIITTDPTPTHLAAMVLGTGHTPSIIDTTEGTILIGQDHIIDPSMTETPVTTEGMHSTLYLTMIAVLVTPLQTDTLEDVPIRIPHTDIGTTYLVTHHTRVIHATTPCITTGPALRTAWALPIDHTQGRYRCHVHGERPHKDPSAKRSLFRTHKWIPPQNWMKTQIH